MDTKIIIMEFNKLNMNINELEKQITQYRQQGYKITSSNMTTVNNIKYSFYIIMEKD